jgi:hypothetical protein
MPVFECTGVRKLGSGGPRGVALALAREGAQVLSRVPNGVNDS